MPKKIKQGQLRKLLKERKQKLLSDLHEEVFEKLGGECQNEFSRALDSGDISFIDLLQTIGAKKIDIRQEELIKMDAAERKLNDGTYGTCEECGLEISEERLAAVPYAVRCIQCEERYEETGIQGRGPTM
jgi:DnaK suppressor protein